MIVRGLGRLGEAAGWFEQAVANRPDYAEARFRLAKDNIGTGDGRLERAAQKRYTAI